MTAKTKKRLADFERAIREVIAEGEKDADTYPSSAGFYRQRVIVQLLGMHKAMYVFIESSEFEAFRAVVEKYFEQCNVPQVPR